MSPGRKAGKVDRREMTVSEWKTSIHRWPWWGLEEGPRGKARVSVSGCLLYSATFVFSFQPAYALILWWYLGPALKKEKLIFWIWGVFVVVVWFWGHCYHCFWISGFSDILDYEINLFLSTLHFFRDSPFSWSCCVNLSCFPQATYELDLIFNQSFQLHFMRKAESSHMAIGISTIKSRGNNWLKEKEIDNWGLFLFSLRSTIGT